MLKVPGLKIINVILGLKCNLKCDHCCTSSSPESNLYLDDEDLTNIKKALSNYDFDVLSFTGGEPTLCLELMNKIIDITTHQQKIHIVTNGWFAKNYDSVKSMLSKINRVSNISLSHDRFHSHLSDAQIQNLVTACKNNNITFNLSACMTNPLDLSIPKLKDLSDIKILYNKIERCGRAKETGTYYKYFEFDSDVLEKQCPNINTITYYPGKGFSTCCLNLLFNSTTNYMYHGSIDEHLNSHFYMNLSKKFGELVSLYFDKTPNFLPRHSSPCGVCELIHQEATLYETKKTDSKRNFV